MRKLIWENICEYQLSSASQVSPVVVKVIVLRLKINRLQLINEILSIIIVIVIVAITYFFYLLIRYLVLLDKFLKILIPRNNIIVLKLKINKKNIKKS